MKIGDLVLKVDGSYDIGKSGVVVSIKNETIGHKIISVLVRGEIKNWAAHLVEVVK